MSNINTIIDISNLIATVIFTEENKVFTVVIKLQNINENNHNYINTFIENDWSTAEDKDLYFININEQTIKATEKPNDNYTWDWATDSWKDQRNIDIITEEVRTRRNELLKASDWTQMPDVILNNKADWAIYRQELRDVTSQPDMRNVTWPIPPQG